MPEVMVEGARLAFEEMGHADAPAVLLLHALGTNRHLWDAQVGPLAAAFRVVRCDLRGHGLSSAPGSAPTLARLGEDAMAVLDAAGIDRAHVCGVSLGGLVGQWLALHAPHRVKRLVLANTAARLASDAFWEARIALVREHGLAPVVEQSPARWFTGRYIDTAPDAVAACQAMVQACSPAGYVWACHVLRDSDLRDEIGRIGCPTLVVGGAHDPVTPPADAAFLARTIPSARVVSLDAAHFASVECAEAFNATVLAFLLEQARDGRSGPP